MEFRLFRDKRHLRKVSKVEFNEALKLDLLPNLPAKAVVQIEATESGSNPNIQIADWVCGALYRYHNNCENGEHYYSILKNSIINKRELFKDYWANYSKSKITSKKR